MRLVDAVVKRTNTDVTDAANVLQDILAAAANERGEWELPLSEENTAAMRQALEARSQHLNEVIDMRRDAEALLLITEYSLAQMLRTGRNPCSLLSWRDLV